MKIQKKKLYKQECVTWSMFLTFFALPFFYVVFYIIK